MYDRKTRDLNRGTFNKLNGASMSSQNQRARVVYVECVYMIACAPSISLMGHTHTPIKDTAQKGES